MVARLAGLLTLTMAGGMVLPIAASFYYADGAQYALIFAALLMTAVGLFLRNIAGRNATYDLRERESFWITSVVWITVPLCGALPYLLTGATNTLTQPITLPGSVGDMVCDPSGANAITQSHNNAITQFTNAAFESISGFTTTGSSVIVRPEDIPQSVLLWRSITQWIGGLGLILLVVALLRRLSGGSLKLYSAEFSGTQQRKLHPHIAKSVSRMWFIYSLITVVLILLLALAGNSALDSVCLALSTVSTGGFMTAQYGLTGYSSLTLSILTVFMFLSGVNVALLYNLFTLKWKRFKVNHEFVLYAVLFAFASLSCFLAFCIVNDEFSILNFQFSIFHIASTISTCGFYTQGPVVWPFWASVVTFLLILSGACAGSTGGGLKLRRLMVLFLYIRNYLTRMVHPHVVFTIKIDHKVVPSDYVNKIFGFLFLYLCFIIGGAFLLTLSGSSIADAFCLAAANISNLGPSPLINSLGANLEYASLPLLSKWTLMGLMLAGRLEIFALLAIFSPAYWRRR